MAATTLSHSSSLTHQIHKSHTCSIEACGNTANTDIRLAVAFLCTRVKNPTTYDWFKLQRMMNFLHRTQSEYLTLALDGSRKVTWSIDAAFAVHPDMKSHSGMSMTMGKGVGKRYFPL